jgi:hypothetical protein
MTAMATRKLPALAATVLLGGCMLFPGWHWAKPGASEADYDIDLKFCKQLIYPGVDGAVTQASVRAMHACMESRGWRKTPD